MSKPRLYGIANSRAFRSVWAIEEVGVEYEHVATHFMEESKDPEYMAINPNGRIPALVDGDLKLFESMAINLYLARAYAPTLLPGNLAGEAQVWQWSVWAISEIEPLQMQIVVQKFFVPEDKRDEKVVAAASKGLARPLQVLDAHLSEREYLVDGGFTIADLNVAAVMDLLSMVQFDLSQFTHVQRWLEIVRARPSYARAKAVGGE